MHKKQYCDRYHVTVYLKDIAVVSLPFQYQLYYYICAHILSLYSQLISLWYHHFCCRYISQSACFTRMHPFPTAISCFSMGSIYPAPTSHNSSNFNVFLIIIMPGDIHLLTQLPFHFTSFYCYPLITIPYHCSFNYQLLIFPYKTPFHSRLKQIMLWALAFCAFEQCSKFLCSRYNYYYTWQMTVLLDYLRLGYKKQGTWVQIAPHHITGHFSALEWKICVL